MHNRIVTLSCCLLLCIPNHTVPSDLTPRAHGTPFGKTEIALFAAHYRRLAGAHPALAGRALNQCEYVYIMALLTIVFGAVIVAYFPLLEESSEELEMLAGIIKQRVIQENKNILSFEHL